MRGQRGSLAAFRVIGMASAFPVIYARDVGRAVSFYERLGFEKHYQFPPDGEPGYAGLRRGDANLGIVHESSPQEMIGKSMGSGPRFDFFVYVDDVDASLESMREAGVPVLRAAEDMPWGERVAFVSDPDGNPVTLAAPTSA
jgi:lactoylglutathione lyase